MNVARTRADFLAARKSLPSPIGLVPTMGALHAGHAALLHAAGEHCASVVTTNFVNPMQFGQNEDLARYPRSLDTDLDICREAAVDLVWVPDVGDVYPHGSAQVSVQPGALGDVLEGASRPGHFAGMCTVVAKFFNLVRPERAYFGEKDYQQLTIVRLMVDDLELGVEVVGVPTVREPDGLAMSSRNVFLSPDERRSALALSAALRAGQSAGTDVLAAAGAVLAAEPGVDLDYLELRAPDLAPAPEHGPARLLVAAHVGTTRLIDNMKVEL